MNGISKLLIIFGAILIITGLILQILPKIPWLGRLPGDVYVKRENFTFYFPIATSIIVSIILSLVFYLFGRR